MDWSDKQIYNIHVKRKYKVLSDGGFNCLQKLHPVIMMAQNNMDIC